MTVMVTALLAALLAACAPEQYTIEFDPAGGTLEKSEMVVEEGVSLDLSAIIPEREGYEFGGWTDENGGAATLIVVNSDMKFTASWTPLASTVTYYVNGEVYASEERVTGEVFAPIEYAGEEGEFFGWYLDAAMTLKGASSITASPKATALYGVFINDENFANTFVYTRSQTAVTIEGIKAHAEVIYIPSSYDGLEVMVGRSAFENEESLKRVYVGAAVTIAEGAFAGSGVTDVYLNGGNYSIKNSALYNGNTLLFLLAGASGDYVVSDDTSKIAAYAFADRKNITSVTIPSSVSAVGARAFADCAEGLKITLQALPGGNFHADWNCKSYDGEEKFSYDLHSSGKSAEGYVYVLRGGRAYILDYVGSESELVLPRTIDGCALVGIERAAFAESEITGIVFPDTLQYIGESAFSGCGYLTSVEFPLSLQSLGASAFAGCVSLEKAVFTSSSTIVASAAFADCLSLSEVILPSALKEIAEDMFANCSSLKEIKLPETLTAIGMGAFYASGIKQISIPASVESIEEHAFEQTGSIDDPESFGRPVVFVLTGGLNGREFDWDAITGGFPYEIK